MTAGRTATGGGRRGRADDPDRTAVVSHEIRGPLGVVGAVCELLLGGGLDAEARRLVELIRLANAQALGVAEDLVAEASLGAGRFRVVPRPVDPAAVLRQVADLWAPMTAGGRHRLEIVVAPDVADLVITDEGRLRQILINLVSNATKASETGTVTLSLAAGADGVVFTVADRGPGLPAGFAPTPFADGGPDRAPASGAGLGLWISSRIAAALDGRLDLADRDGGGTVATLALPTAVAATRPAGAPASRRRPAARRPRASAEDTRPTAEATEAAMTTPDDEAAGGRRIRSPLADRVALVVDDSAVSRMLLETILGSFDMTVDLAANGEEAVTAARRRRPDVVLLDWALRQETGADVIDRLEAVLADAVPPVVTVSAAGAAVTAARTAGHVVKPFTPRELHRCLEAALAGESVEHLAG